MGITDEAMFGLINEHRSLQAENAMLKSRLIDEFKKLKAENAALKSRLDKAVELPFIAMIEQRLDNGKFAKSAQQKFNGRYCVVYFDKSKWGSPLIDICGLRPYSSDEAQAKLDEMKGGADKCNG